MSFYEDHKVFEFVPAPTGMCLQSSWVQNYVTKEAITCISEGYARLRQITQVIEATPNSILRTYFREYRPDYIFYHSQLQSVFNRSSRCSLEEIAATCVRELIGNSKQAKVANIFAGLAKFQIDCGYLEPEWDVCSFDDIQHTLVKGPTEVQVHNIDLFRVDCEVHPLQYDAVVCTELRGSDYLNYVESVSRGLKYNKYFCLVLPKYQVSCDLRSALEKWFPCTFPLSAMFGENNAIAGFICWQRRPTPSSNSTPVSWVTPTAAETHEAHSRLYNIFQATQQSVNKISSIASHCWFATATAHQLLLPFLGGADVANVASCSIQTFATWKHSKLQLHHTPRAPSFFTKLANANTLSQWRIITLHIDGSVQRWLPADFDSFISLHPCLCSMVINHCQSSDICHFLQQTRLVSVCLFNCNVTFEVAEQLNYLRSLLSLRLIACTGLTHLNLVNLRGLQEMDIIACVPWKSVHWQKSKNL
jgi:hypothetical protein